jgi:hypothetical protein
MKDNTILLIVAEAGLITLGIAGLCTHNEPLAYTAAGAFVGVVSGHLNGAQADKPKTPEA